jgi:SUKH-4 immunity protein
MSTIFDLLHIESFSWNRKTSVIEIFRQLTRILLLTSRQSPRLPSNMKPDDIVKSWSPNDRRRWPAQCLRDVAIPEPSKSFLVEVGLPAYRDVGFQFDPLVGDPPKLVGRPHLRSIGLMYESALVCLDEQADGCVINVDPELRDLDRYINSSVDRFAASLILYLQHRSTGQRSTPAEYEDLVARLEGDSLNVDPTVFHDPENFWAVIVWEMKEGLG